MALPRNLREKQVNDPIYRFLPAQFAKEQLGLKLYQDQEQVFNPNIRRGILNCCRQWGKSTVIAARAIHHALYNDDSLILILAPSERQSKEFVRKAKSFARKLGIKPRGDGDNTTSLQLPNNSRLVGLPANKDTGRGFSGVSLLLVDEASRVEDELFHAIMPATAAHHDPTIWLMSTPNGRRGFFYNNWINETSGYTRISVPATACPRIPTKFLDEQRAQLPKRDFNQEYLCEFHEPNDAIFSMDLIKKCYVDDPPYPFPTFSEKGCYEVADLYRRNLIGIPYYYIGIDLGQQNDYTAIAVLEKLRRYLGISKLTGDHAYENIWTLRHIERVPLRTSYIDIVDTFSSMTQELLFKRSCTFVVDATGVGRPVYELLQKKVKHCGTTAINITGGFHESQNNGTRNVPKSAIISKLQLTLETKQLKIPRSLKHLPMLLGELENFKATTNNNGHTTLGAAHGQHDDLLMAVALAVYQGMKGL